MGYIWQLLQQLQGKAAPAFSEAQQVLDTQKRAMQPVHYTPEQQQNNEQVRKDFWARMHAKEQAE